MEKFKRKNKRDLLSNYGYSNHQLTFISTTEYIQNCEDIAMKLKISEQE